MMFRFSSVSLCDAKATSVAAEHNSSATTSMCNGHSLGAMSITMQPSVIQQKLFSKRRHLRQAMWPSSLSPTICTPSSVAKVGVRNFLNRENSDKWKMSAAFCYSNPALEVLLGTAPQLSPGKRVHQVCKAAGPKIQPSLSLSQTKHLAGRCFPNLSEKETFH